MLESLHVNMQADPGIGSVATLAGREDQNYWLETLVTTHRWQLLAQQTPTKKNDNH